MMSSVVSPSRFSRENAPKEFQYPSNEVSLFQPAEHTQVSERDSDDGPEMFDEFMPFPEMVASGAHEAFIEEMHPWLTGHDQHAPPNAMDLRTVYESFLMHPSAWESLASLEDDVDAESIWWDDETTYLDRLIPKRDLDHGFRKRRPPSCLVLIPMEQVFAHYHLLHLSVTHHTNGMIHQVIQNKIELLRLKKHKDTHIWGGNKMTGMRGGTDSPSVENVQHSSLPTPPLHVFTRHSPLRSNIVAQPAHKTNKRKRTGPTKFEPNKIQKTKNKHDKSTIRPFDPTVDTYPGTDAVAKFRALNRAMPPKHVRVSTQTLYQLKLNGEKPLDYDPVVISHHNASEVLQAARIDLLSQLSAEVRDLKKCKYQGLRLQKLSDAKERIRMSVPNHKRNNRDVRAENMPETHVEHEADAIDEMIE